MLLDYLPTLLDYLPMVDSLTALVAVIGAIAYHRQMISNTEFVAECAYAVARSVELHVKALEASLGSLREGVAVVDDDHTKVLGDHAPHIDKLRRDLTRLTALTGLDRRGPASEWHPWVCHRSERAFFSNRADRYRRGTDPPGHLARRDVHSATAGSAVDMV
jgi:hypothetical protein